MLSMTRSVRPRPDELSAALVGDDLVPDPDVVMNRAFTVPADLDEVWPWFVQLGKRRAGWYLTGALERFVPRGRRALRRIEPRFQGLQVGDLIPDWGGRDATFEVAVLNAPRELVHWSRRGATKLSWAIVLTPEAEPATRVHLRLRLAPVKHPRLADSLGGLVDLVTVAGLAAGLNERLRDQHT